MVLIKNVKNFHLFIFGKMREENVFNNILQRKKAFLDYKKEKVKKSKIGIFPIGIFDQKCEKFPSLYFWQNQRGKCV